MKAPPRVPEVCTHALFELQVARDPEAVAVVFGARQLTYRELNERANQVAHHLRRLGIGPDVLVGVCLERCPELVIALLGVWKAGGAYVPLDPAYPPERLAFMLADSGARVLLTESKCRALFPSGPEHVLCLDSQWESFASEETGNPAPTAGPSNLAYVMYTSGSTGQPKGAMILHRGLVNYLTWAIDAYRVERDGAVPVHTSISFDLTVTSLFPALLAGAQVELLPEDFAAQNLVAALKRRKNWTLVKITPAHLDLLRQQIRPEEAAALTKLFVIGGENLLAETLQLWRDFAPDTRLINEYGPTETVVGCCVYEVRPEDPRTGSVPIGRAIAHTTLHLLDPELRQVSRGKTGELYIGGAGVARGYLNRPELTGERFLDDPFDPAEGARLYRSGDLARCRDDGTLEYLGRLDDQVKVRGYRIELGEIEAVLAAHPGVHSCAVLARDDATGSKQLVGYVVAQGSPPFVEELQRFLGARLPEHMVPPQVVFLEALPLTQNGKVDRKALPAPSSASGPAQQPYSAPRTETERVIAEIWAKVLGVERVGIDQDFFDLGGHSLLAIQTLAKMRDALHVDLPPQTLFDHSTVAALAALVPTEEAVSAEPARPPLVPNAGPPAVSFAEEQLWLLNQLAPDSPAYNIGDRVVFREPWDSAAMQRAIDELVRRHQALRTAFTWQSGALTGTVRAVTGLAVPEFDLSGWPPPEQAREWARLAREHVTKTFDLSHPPLIRFAVVHLSPVEHRLLVCVHHLVADEWSMEILHRELRQLVRDAAQGRPFSLPPLPIQVSDFAAWQHSRLQGEALEPELRYWQEELQGAPTVLGLPTDKSRPAVRSLAGATHSFSLPKALLGQLQALGRKEGATLFVVLEAAFAALLHRATGQDDLLIGTPVSLRTHTETQGLIGCFLNTVALRAQLDGEPSFEVLLRQTRDRALRMHAHAELPFERVVEALAPQRDPGRTPLVQVMFIHHGRESATQVSNLNGSPELQTGTSKFDLTLATAETEDGLEAQFEYSTELFEAASIRRLAGVYAALLEQFVLHPAQKLATLSTLAGDDRRQLLTGWNATAVTFPGGELTLPRLLARQARRPGRIAVVCGEEEVSWDELDARANQLANHLRVLGVGPDVLVGLLVERSVEMMVGLWGILKAGGAYVPLDPAFPADRLHHMVENSRMKVLITHRGLLETLEVRPPHVVHFGRNANELATHSRVAPPVPELRREHLAYVLFTSGSTGLPKGVAIPHSAIVNLLLSMQREPGLRETDTLLAVTTLSFDIAGLELFLPLLTGARLVIASRDDAIDPALLMKRMRASRCTVMQATPATWRALIAGGWEGTAGLKVLCGGEALAPDLGRSLLSRCAEVWNLYGPTETTVWSTLERVVSVEGPIPIGRPIANTQAYVLDAERQLVAPGLIGELYLGGDGLARGYLHREELTKERFVPSPFTPGARLYRTGDLARWRLDGRLECLGRTDHQVKLRGYRIELGEIEACLARHPKVGNAVVIAREDLPGDKRLVAYVVAPGAPPDLFDQLRALLRGALPRYMIPAQFVALAALPLTPNGKIDRKALPAPAEEQPARAAVLAPGTEAERTIAEIWARVLKVASVGVDQDFFDLGGNSLLAIQALSKIRDALRVELAPHTLFEHPTVAALAAVLSKAKGAVGAPAPGVNAGPPVVSFAEEQLWVVNQLAPDSPAYNIGDLLLLRGPYDAPATLECLNQLVRRHPALRTGYRYEDTGLTRVVHPELSVDLSEIDLSGLPEEARQREWLRVARAHVRQCFDLSRPPLIRFAVVHWSATEHRLLINVHHLVADEWSLEVLQREWQEFVAAKEAGRAPALAPLPIQVADFAAWQQHRLQGGMLEEELAHWKGELKGAPTVLSLPIDRPRPAVRSLAGATHRFTVPAALLERLRALGRQEGATLFMVLEAAFAALLSRATGQQDLLVGTPISLRTHTETQGLVGCLLNTVVLRSEFDDETSFASLLRQTRDRSLRAYAHAELPFKRLVEELGPRRDPGQTALVQVMFVLHTRDGAARLSKTAGTPELETGTSKFDLSLYTAETEAGLEVQLEYSTELFEPATIRRLGADYAELLEAAVADPGRRLALNGKSDRQPGLSENVARSAPHPGRPAVSASDEPRTEMERAIAEAWSELLKVARPKRSDNFFDLGGESLIAIQMSRRLRQQFGFEMPLAVLLESPSLGACAAILDGLRGAARSPTRQEFDFLVTIRPGAPTRLPFFCAAGAGGNVLNLRDLANCLDAEQPFIGIQARGVDGREPHHTVQEQASAYLGEIRVRQPRGPYLLGGYSGGGVVAYEMAQQLSAAGEAVALLAFFDAWSPKMVREPPNLENRLARLRDDGLAYLPRLIKRRLDRRSERQVHARVRQLMEAGAPIPPEVREVFLYFTHGDAIRSYQPKPWSGQATLFRASINYAFSGGGWAFAWDELMPGRVEVVVVPGEHANLLAPGNVGALGRALDLALSRAQPKG